MAVEQGVRSARTGDHITATGRRKTAVARVRLRTGTGGITVNGRNVDITVDGGGPTGQAGACRLGIARALKALESELAEPLRQGGLLTRDGRMKERKKYGLRGARRGTQFSKR